MKIRSGFVSNSSTSSFVIYGLRADKDFNSKCTQYAKDTGMEFEECNDGEIWMGEFAEQLDLVCYDIEDDDGGYVIGFDINDSGCDEYLEYKETDVREIKTHEGINTLCKITGKEFTDMKIISGTRPA